MLLGVTFSLPGLGLLIALMFQMVIFALPLFVGVTVGRFADDSGARALGVIIMGGIAVTAALSLPMLQGKMDGTSGSFQPSSGVFHPPVRCVVGA